MSELMSTRPATRSLATATSSKASAESGGRTSTLRHLVPSADRRTGDAAPPRAMNPFGFARRLPIHAPAFGAGTPIVTLVQCVPSVERRATWVVEGVSASYG